MPLVFLLFGGSLGVVLARRALARVRAAPPSVAPATSLLPDPVATGIVDAALAQRADPSATIAAAIAGIPPGPTAPTPQAVADTVSQALAAPPPSVAEVSQQLAEAAAGSFNPAVDVANGF